MKKNFEDLINSAWDNKSELTPQNTELFQIVEQVIDDLVFPF